MVSGPTVRRRQLGAELRRLREAAGRSIEDAAAHLECSTARISRIETGQRGATVRLRDVKALLELYGAADNQRLTEEITALAREAQTQGWWQPYESVMPTGFDILVGLENDATTEHVFEPLLVPGLLQTPEYARALIKVGRSGADKTAERLVALRMERQAVLTRGPDPLALWAVIDEAALRRPIGSPDIMRAQIRHLIEVADLPNVKIQVLPFACGAHAGLNGAFTVLELPEAPTVVYTETQAGDIYVEKDRDVRRFVETFGVLRVTALGFEQTLAFLDHLTKET